MGLFLEIAVFVTKTLVGLLNKYKTWRKWVFFAEMAFLFPDIELMMYLQSGI